mmetsp:Transcript_44843/g.105645  ORF Transcript_44843/g.105645 Transcript_44843/m.105645 type:complete len:425 (-) Transcript_44843:795-2069(-)
MQIDLGVGRERAGGREQVGLAAALQRPHRFAQHVVVELEAHLHHVAALVVAQHLTGAADLQVVHRQVEARAQFFHGLDGVQALRGLLGQALDVGHHQIGIGLVVTAADPAAQLVQLGQAELVGAADDDGVGTRHVDAGLDDGRAQQQVVLALHELAHHPLQLALGHLAMGDDDACLGQQLLELLAPVLDGLDLVVQEVDLAAALQLAQHRLADGAAALGAHEGLDRQAPLRRGRDDGQVAQAFQRHAERARDGRGGQRQHVHLGAHRLHGLLVAHAEAVFLVDDQQAQPVELDLGGQQLVRAHDDVDAAVGNALHRCLDLLGRAEAAHLRHLDRPGAESVGDVLVVLLGQQRRRRQDGHLLAPHHGHKGGAQRDLGLAEAHVAADQAVHGLRGNHVLDDRVDGRALVRRFLEAEARGKGLVVMP